MFLMIVNTVKQVLSRKYETEATFFLAKTKGDFSFFFLQQSSSYPTSEGTKVQTC